MISAVFPLLRRSLSPLFAFGAITALGGCQFNHAFRLDDIQQLTPGESTKQDLDRIFGPRDFVLYTTYSSWQRDQVFPPLPLSLLSWPLFLQTHDQRYQFHARIDSHNQMTAGILQISEESATNILLLFGPSDYTVHLEPREVRLLRELQAKGIEVHISEHPIRCFGGVIGWMTVPLEEYLQRKE